MSDIRLSRKHKTYFSRATQLVRNAKSWRGGSEYIDLALTRFPSESDVSWIGDPVRGILSRKKRTSYINYAGRIVSKINQYVFGQDIERDGIDPKFSDDATKGGQSISALMEDACSHITIGAWCWIQADRSAPDIDPETKRPRPRTVADRERIGDRVFWQLWEAHEVVDWRFGLDGELDWLITEQEVYENEDVNVSPKERKLRTIWMRGEGVRLWYDGDDIKIEEKFTFSIKRVPFEPVGLPSCFPHWFDDVERVQAGLLNLESAHREALFEAVFPQLVIPSSMISDLMAKLELKGSQGAKRVLEMIRGLSFPILEPVEANGLTRYIMPANQDMKSLPDEITRQRRELFEIVGLAMANKDTAQVQSADSKAWDNLDPAAVMRARAVKLEEAERKMIELSVMLDTGFKRYQPAYPRTFNLVDFAADIKGVVELDNSVSTTELRREMERIKAVLLSQRFGITADRRKQILDDIDASDFSPPAVLPFSPFTRNEEDED